MKVKMIHKFLGEVYTTEQTRKIQALNFDPTSLIVEHEGEIKEVSRALCVYSTEL